MAAHKPWTDAEDQFLIEHHGQISNREIGKRLDRPVYVIENRVFKLRREGVLAMPSAEPKWTEADDRKLIAGYARFTITMLAEDFGRTPEAVRSRLRRLKQAGWQIEAMPRGPNRSKAAEQARAEQHNPELSAQAEREAIRDEVIAYLAYRVARRQMPVDRAKAVVKAVSQAPEHQFKRLREMSVAEIVRAAA